MVSPVDWVGSQNVDIWPVVSYTRKIMLDYFFLLVQSCLFTNSSPCPGHVLLNAGGIGQQEAVSLLSVPSIFPNLIPKFSLLVFSLRVPAGASQPGCYETPSPQGWLWWWRLVKNCAELWQMHTPCAAGQCLMFPHLTNDHKKNVTLLFVRERQSLCPLVSVQFPWASSIEMPCNITVQNRLIPARPERKGKNFNTLQVIWASLSAGWQCFPVRMFPCQQPAWISLLPKSQDICEICWVGTKQTVPMLQ